MGVEIDSLPTAIALDGTESVPIVQGGTTKRTTTAAIAAQTTPDLDDISSTQGVLLYRSATDWTSLAPGTSGHYLKTQGAAANPVWAAAPGDVSAASAFGTDNVLIRSDGTSKGVQSTGITVADTTNDVSGTGFIKPASNDGGALGDGTHGFSDLFLASGGVVNFNNGDVTVTHSANYLAFDGASSGYGFSHVVRPSSNDGAPLGEATVSWADLFLASGGVISFNNGDVTVTHSANTLTFAGAASGYLFDVGLSPTSLTTPYNADPASGYFATYDGAAANLFTLTQATALSSVGDGAWRSAQAMWHNDNDATNYSSVSYRVISDALRVGAFGPNDGAGTYSADYKDHHGITSSAISRTEWSARGTAAFAGESVQFGTGVCLGAEYTASNPSASSNQAGQIAGLLLNISGKKAASDASHVNYGVLVQNVGKRATAAFRAYSLGTDGDNGQYEYFLHGSSATVDTAAIVMPDSASGNVGSYIVYDSGDYSHYDKVGNSFIWAIGATNRLNLDAGNLFPSTARGLSLGSATYPFAGAYLGSGVVREPLGANRTYYVRTDGSDSNTGLVDSAGGAFLTLQKGWDVVSESLDLCGYDVTIQVRGGGYTAGMIAIGPVVGGGTVTFVGDLVTPTNVLVTATSSNCFFAYNGAMFRVRGMEMRTVTSGNHLNAYLGGIIYFDTVVFGVSAGNHIEAALDGLIRGDGNYTISGNAGSHLHSYSSGLINLSGMTVTVSGTPAFSNYFVGVAAAHVNCSSVTWSGAATGQRFLVHKQGQIETGTGSLTHFPGSTAGVINSDGVYDGLRGDLQMQSGGVINFASGDYTLTHSTGALTAAGGPYTAPSFIPSASTVPTNGFYLPAANTLGWSINSVAEMQLTSSALSPAANDGNALGTTALGWSDLHLASGSVINWVNGEATLTQTSADVLTLAGATLVLPNAGLQMGASVPFSDSSGTLTLQNVDAIDAATLGTISTAQMGTLTNYTPSLTSTGGNFTTATVSGDYVTVGKMTYLTVSVVITTVGPGSGAVIVGLPNTAAKNAQLTGDERGVTGYMVYGNIGATATTVSILNYNFTSPIAAGATIIINGWYNNQ